MSISLEVDSSDANIEPTEDPFTILNDSALGSDESQSESSDSSFLDIDLDDEFDDEEIDTIESIEVDEHQVNKNLEDVSSYTIGVIPELHYEILSL
jgi:hypothetical protein